jgi:hypothetical protein
VYTTRPTGTPASRRKHSWRSSTRKPSVGNIRPWSLPGAGLR